MTIHLDVEPLCLSVDATESRIAVGCASGEVAIIGVHREVGDTFCRRVENALILQPYEFERHVSLRKAYDTKEQKTQRALFASHSAPVRQVAFSADAQLLVSGDEEGTLRYLHVKSGQVEREVNMKGLFSSQLPDTLELQAKRSARCTSSHRHHRCSTATLSHRYVGCN